MYYEAIGAIAADCGHAERVGHQDRRLRAFDRPADDEPREGVEDDAAVDLALPCRVLGDVGHPQLVGPVAAKDAADEVQVGDLGDLRPLREPARRQTLDPQLAHDRPDRVVADDDVSPVAQLRGDAHLAAGAARGLVDVGDLASQPDPAQGARRVGAVPPGVIAGLRDVEHAAGVAHVDPLPGQGLDHREEPFGGRSPSRKTSLTLRETASSVSSCLIRRLAAASSSAWSVLVPSISRGRSSPASASYRSWRRPCRRSRRAGQLSCRIELARSPEGEPLWGTCGASESSYGRRTLETELHQIGGRSRSPSNPAWLTPTL
jgi:hypothetical protein